MLTQSRVLSAALAVACSAAHAPAQTCAEWDGRFGDPGAGGEPTHNQTRVWEPFVRTFTEHDHGAGPVLYAAGEFTHVGGVPARHVGMSADGGRTWQAMDTGIIHAGALSWSRVWSSGGFGDSVYFGGIFLDAGGFTASRIARWNGSEWVPMPGLDGQIHPTLIEAKAMATWDDGRGEALYVGGRFPEAGGIAVNNIARWDGAAWEPLGSGANVGAFPVGGSGQDVNALAAFQDKLYVGGSFRRAGAVSAERMAAWDGSGWAPIPGSPTGGAVNTLIVFDDGAGEALYVGGDFETLGPMAVNGVARFDGQAWTALGDGLMTGWIDTVTSLAVYNDGRGPALFAGGYFPALAHLARFDGQRWETVGGGVAVGDPPVVTDLKSVGDGLLVGGQFAAAGAVTANSMARWACDGPAPCYPDCDGNGVLDFFDFLCFQNAFLAGDPYADCDGNGVLDFFDFLCFQNEFLAGCP